MKIIAENACMAIGETLQRAMALAQADEHTSQADFAELAQR